jgi:tRNA(fMet)-specific endonuclease VapC
MDRLTYILDTNVIADYLNGVETTTGRIDQALKADLGLVLTPPIYYEVRRGLLKVDATRKTRIFEDTFMPQFQWEELIQADWELAARYWADTSRQGRQFSDVDLLIAAMATRLDAVIVSSDADFEALPVKREDWRIPLSDNK